MENRVRSSANISLSWKKRKDGVLHMYSTGMLLAKMSVSWGLVRNQLVIKLNARGRISLESSQATVQ